MGCKETRTKRGWDVFGGFQPCKDGGGAGMVQFLVHVRNCWIFYLDTVFSGHLLSFRRIGDALSTAAKLNAE
ncbi:unnamed protein product, partial [Dovyalis caffra]